ncbi:hypothetical protein [Leptospira wolffii]|uniref:hypothetical protein n=1 Tax=Leptospira wolffii TaxID=409998 RepID=UPI00058DDF92|nr:hypothetical protein [Leptospira wolffii]
MRLRLTIAAVLFNFLTTCIVEKPSDQKKGCIEGMLLVNAIANSPNTPEYAAGIMDTFGYCEFSYRMNN